MKVRILSLCGALALCLTAIAGMGPAQAAALCSSNYCSTAERACKAGCPCALFYCDPVACTHQCVCPIFCPEES